MEGIRHALRYNQAQTRDSFTAEEWRCVRICKEISTSVGFTQNPRWLGLPTYEQWDLAELKQLVLVHDLWEERYAGATGVNLMLQFIGAITTHTNAMVWAEVNVFVRNTCRILQTISGTNTANMCDKRNRTTVEVLQLTIRFMTDHRQRIRGAMHNTPTLEDFSRRNDSDTLFQSELTNEMDDFIDDLFTLLDSTQLNNEIYVSMWTLLQVGGYIQYLKSTSFTIAVDYFSRTMLLSQSLYLFHHVPFSVIVALFFFTMGPFFTMVFFFNRGTILNRGTFFYHDFFFTMVLFF
jgi:hypothetical protein